MWIWYDIIIIVERWIRNECLITEIRPFKSSMNSNRSEGYGVFDILRPDPGGLIASLQVGFPLVLPFTAEGHGHQKEQWLVHCDGYLLIPGKQNIGIRTIFLGKGQAVFRGFKLMEMNEPQRLERPGWRFHICLIFTPIWWRWTQFDSYVSGGWEKPTTRQSLCCISGFPTYTYSSHSSKSQDPVTWGGWNCGKATFVALRWDASLNDGCNEWHGIDT